MSDSHEGFEQQLRSMEPARPSRRLESAIAADLGRETGSQESACRIPRRVLISLWTSWSITAIAATIAVVVLLEDRAGMEPMAAVPRAPEPSAADVAKVSTADPALRLTPVSANGILYGADFEGIVWIDEGIPARRMRFQFMDTVEMRAPDGAASVAVTYPREEIRFVPINAY